jgi:hypothetical protein
MSDEIQSRLIGCMVCYVIRKLHFTSSRIWKCKGKGQPMICLSKDRTEGEVYFHLIRIQALEGSA